MAVAWIDVGGHWGLTQFTKTRLESLGYEVELWAQGWTDTYSGRRAALLDITGGGRVCRELATERWPDRD